MDASDFERRIAHALAADGKLVLDVRELAPRVMAAIMVAAAESREGATHDRIEQAALAALQGR